MLSRIQSRPVRSFSAPLLALVSMGCLLTFQWSCSGGGEKQVAQNTPPAANTTTQNNDDPKGLKRAAKALVDNLVAENFDGVEKEFDDGMKQAVPPDKLKNDWTSTVKRLGPCKSQGPPSLSRTPQGMDAVVIRCQMEHGSLDIEVDYGATGKVSGGLWLRQVG